MMMRQLAALVLLLPLLLLAPVLAQQGERRVAADGSGEFTTIQACANAVKPGETCVVSAGVYDEHVTTAAGGTDGARITFRAAGVVTMQGFDLQHPHVTVEGFDITDSGPGLTWLTGYGGFIQVMTGGDHCEIFQNTIRDGEAARVMGINFSIRTGRAQANNCVVRGNTLTNLSFVFLTTAGEWHLFEANTFEQQNSQDYIRLFGANHVFRRNIFHKGKAAAGIGNHPDFIQVFGGATWRSENHLFEENWIQDLESQLGQMNAGDGVVLRGIVYDNVQNVTFRRNVIVNVAMNLNLNLPGVRFEHNTFYRMAYSSTGIGYGGSLTRGETSRGFLRQNVFLAGGQRADEAGDSAGFYTVTGTVLSREVVAALITHDLTRTGSDTLGIHADLSQKGYIDSNGKILDKARTLLSLEEFELDPAYDVYRSVTYDVLTRTVASDTQTRSTFSADYNFVAGSPGGGFPAKRTRECTALGSVVERNFCEPRGINGGDPRLQNINDPLGPDGLPFTADDGLIPLADSPLCGAGEGGSDIGAYACVAPDPGPEPCVFQPAQFRSLAFVDGALVLTDAAGCSVKVSG